MFPRFMKWDIGKFDQKVGVDLSGPVNFQVKVDQLRSFEYEREMMGADVVMFGDVQADVVDCVAGDDAFVEGGVGIDTEKCDAMHTDDLECGFGVVQEECSSWEGQKAGSPLGGNEADVLRSSVFVNNSEGVKGSRVDEYVNAIAILELENKRKDGMIALLEGEVCRDGCGGNDEGVKVGGEIVYNVSPIRAGLSPKYVSTEAVGPSIGCDVVDSVGEQRGRCAGSFLKVDLCDMDDGLIVSRRQTSFVRNIKNKVRQEKKLPNFEYPILNGRNKKSVTDAGVVVRSDDFASNSGIIDVDVVVVKGSKWSGFDINNRLGVWKMMTVEEKSKIKQGYDRHGDRAVMWEDRDAGVVVDFTDVKNIIRQSAVCGNVIDGYVELLKSEHVKMYGADGLDDKSYFFSSVCLDMIKSDDVRAREKFVRTNVSAATDCRFIHFPMCHDGHWTLVVYDTEEGTWKHYNPMRQRGDRADVHYRVATLLKERVTDVMEQTLREFGLDEQSIRANFNSTLEDVTKCPQQKPGTLDCGVLVCAIMRQYVHRADVERSLHGSNCIILRANMVKAFVNDPTRGLKE
ncbi:hypothetical protein LOK49_LG07G00678 [Camellia lanceoleosa]|uniref:Uncharacterized protein n=1 Tax=Camellia lanceoleosa TaxID=1840588 RepID=A0ACC0H642_9ERIC|nr:hypothetical protein LOK49_LG07G00678 [Camellia lanceoleosa]